MKVIDDETFTKVIREFQKLVAAVEQQLNRIITRVDLLEYEDFVEYVYALDTEVETLKELCHAGYRVCYWYLQRKFC